MKMEELKGVLRELGKAERKQALDYLLLLGRGAEEDSSGKNRWLGMWCDSLSVELGRAVGRPGIPVPASLHGAARVRLAEADEIVAAAGASDPLKTGDRKFLYNEAARSLVLNASSVASRAKIPLTMKLVVQGGPPLAALLDDSFPGYLRSGNLLAVVKAGRRRITATRGEE